MAVSATELLPITAEKQRWGGLVGCALPIAIAKWCASNKNQVRLLVTPSHQDAYTLYKELQFLLPEATQLYYFPDWETLPYDQFSPHEDIISERLDILSKLQQQSSMVVIACISTLMHRLAPPHFLQVHALSLKPGQSLHIDKFRAHLIEAGYRAVNTVFEHGEFVLRGGILDLFPMGSETPFRIECFDDEVESIRTFNPENQKTIEKISGIRILPARECPLNETSIATFRQAFREVFSGNPSLSPIYESITAHQFPQGIEYYLPLFFERCASIFDYLPEDAAIGLIGQVANAAESFMEEVQSRFTQKDNDPLRPPLAPETVFIAANPWFEQAKRFAPMRIESEIPKSKAHAIHFNTVAITGITADKKSKAPLKQLSAYMAEHDNRIIFSVESLGRREALLALLAEADLKPAIHTHWDECLADSEPLSIIVAPFTQGVTLLDAKLSIITETELFGELKVPVRQRRDKHTQNPDLLIRNLAELKIGDPLVHLEYGIGRYQGLITLDNAGLTSEFIVLTYRDDDKIYVPVTALHLLSRYTGADEDSAPLHKLGTDKWHKARQKAFEKMHDVAVELLDTQAKRAARPGFAHQFTESDYQAFLGQFPFEETGDQTKATADILKDMQASNPMDRLICGDVGFGKTEVAMRAAFIAVQSNKQVCVLAPTTLLAAQHFENFKDRFADFAINIGLLSRFNTPKESEATIEKVKSGTIDIIIGTHKLLQKGIQYKALGLLIIDEEHRFGVKQKEHIKSLRTNVDILSMTATPIPRTLNMAMSGMRDISLIATPPLRRLAIKTFWQEKNDVLIREAMLREILRGGQVFFLHNNVQTIEHTLQSLQKLVPEANIKVAHGQMRERELEHIMSDFYHQRFNVLLCTTIIETGIDIPTANTIIIDKAQHFGLAQLHQLRGRVGRSHHQAYAYLLSPKHELLTADAKKRLEAITSIEDLGAGFMLATHDLEIRGAGELLGEEQSGNMHAIGFDLYMDMLKKTIDALKAGKMPELTLKEASGPDIELGISAIIPEAYVPDVHTRLTLYKRIAEAKTNEALKALKIELIDRFGLMPDQVLNLFEITSFKHFATSLGVLSVKAQTQNIRIAFSEKPNVDLGKLIGLIQSKPDVYQLNSQNQLTIKNQELPKSIEKVQWLRNCLTSLK